MSDARKSSEEGGARGLRPRRLVGDAGDVGGTDGSAGRRGPAAVRARCARLLGLAWVAVRPSRRRATGYIAICSVGALLGTSIAVGSGKAGAVPDLADIGAWLTSSRTGEAAHANGLTGDVDGKVKLPGMGDHPVSVSQDGKTVLVLDKKTGKVVRIDPSQLTAEQSSRYGSGRLQLVAGGSYAYLVDPVKSTVQRIDPVRTTPVGGPVGLGAAPLGKAVADADGTLWVPQPAKGRVVPLSPGKKGGPRVEKARGIEVAGPGKRASALVMTLAGGRPVVTDTEGGTVTLLHRKGRGLRFKLPRDIRSAPAGSVLVPPSTAGDLVPVLARRSGRMALVNTRTGTLLTARLGASRQAYGTPQVLGSKVYVPDQGNGTLRVYDTEAAAIERPVKVTGKRGELSLFVRDGLLWVNDEDNATAVVINAKGDVNRVRKYRDDAPSGRKPRENVPGDSGNRSPAPGPNASDPGPEGPAGPNDPGRDGSRPGAKPGNPAPAKPSPGNKHKPGANPKPDPDKPGDKPEAVAPGTPQAQSGAGFITVAFAPSSGVRPTGYRLRGAPAGAQVKPRRVGPGGPFTFQMSGGECGKEYTFTVVAEFSDGSTEESARSGPTRPCVAPGAPQNLKHTFPQGGKGIDLTWDKPANAGAEGTTYTVSGAGAPQPAGGRTALALRGLRNGQTYNLSVAAANAAGSGGATSLAVELSQPVNRNIEDNVDDGKGVGVRSRPSSSEGERLEQIPSGQNPGIKVICQTTGTQETHDTHGWQSDIWDRVEWNGRTAYVSDLWLDFSNKQQGKFSPEVWQCD
ncbi:fibronectin type III domain-containing protein [Streptomyces axinellae]|uniref:Fibronectin type-III domain-containing protein n=1 Tax=Streptomyces axinellae TaxID=552788 RepID=A0ABN3QU52_9ACTN